MRIAEDKNKIKNIVEGSMHHLSAIYFSDFTIQALHDVDTPT